MECIPRAWPTSGEGLQTNTDIVQADKTPNAAGGIKLNMHYLSERGPARPQFTLFVWSGRKFS